MALDDRCTSSGTSHSNEEERIAEKLYKVEKCRRPVANLVAEFMFENYVSVIVDQTPQ